MVFSYFVKNLHVLIKTKWFREIFAQKVIKSAPNIQSSLTLRAGICGIKECWKLETYLSILNLYNVLKSKLEKYKSRILCWAVIQPQKRRKWFFMFSFPCPDVNKKIRNHTLMECSVWLDQPPKRWTHLLFEIELLFVFSSRWPKVQMSFFVGCQGDNFFYIANKSQQGKVNAPGNSDIGIQGNQQQIFKHSHQEFIFSLEIC